MDTLLYKSTAYALLESKSLYSKNVSMKTYGSSMNVPFSLLFSWMFLTIRLSINTLMLPSKNDLMSCQVTNDLKYFSAFNNILSLSPSSVAYVHTFQISLENTWINPAKSSLYFKAYNNTHFKLSPLHLNIAELSPYWSGNLNTNFMNSIHCYKLSSKCGCKSYHNIIRLLGNSNGRTLSIRISISYTIIANSLPIEWITGSTMPTRGDYYAMYCMSVWSPHRGGQICRKTHTSQSIYELNIYEVQYLISMTSKCNWVVVNNCSECSSGVATKQESP